MENRKNFLKEASILMIVTVLLFSIVPVVANTNISKSEENIHALKPQYEQSMQDETWTIIISENFTDGNMPPTGEWGDWNLTQTNLNETWEINDVYCYEEPYSAFCNMDPGCDFQNESLTTPSLNFSKYSEIYLEFRWFMSEWHALTADYYDLNVLISTDDEATWTLIWNEDKFGGFSSWIWHNANMNDPVDLSIYAGNSSVKIRFQYTGEYNQADLGLDTIIVRGDGEPTPFKCSAGGEYNGWASYEVEFHGGASGGTEPYSYSWDFGDDSTNVTTKDPIHTYDWPGTYIVVLTVIDADNHITFDDTIAIIDPPHPHPPQLQITDIKGTLFGLKVTIKNNGGDTANFSDVKFNITIRGGILSRTPYRKNVVWPNMTGHYEEDIYCLWFFRNGKLDIKILLETYASMHEVTCEAVRIGPFVFNVRIT